MANEETSGKICFTKKKIRLSQVVDKLAELGNGNLMADKENNNVSVSQQKRVALQMMPQVACTAPPAFPHTPVLPEAGSVLAAYAAYSQAAYPRGSYHGKHSPPSHTVTSGSYQPPVYSFQATTSHPSIVNPVENQFNRLTLQERHSRPRNRLEIIEQCLIKQEVRHAPIDGYGAASQNEAKKPKIEANYEVQQYQQVPLDLSVRGNNTKRNNNKTPKSKRPTNREGGSGKGKEKAAGSAYPEVCGDVASPTTRQSVAARYNLHVSPVVEQMPLGSDTAWACPVCGQLFSQRDRLAKHVASRHRGRSPSRSHVCGKCGRGFSRSDMLTRHLRLHSGHKPYRCAVCGQIFSRSDHLATHRRTHTGEKPYKCPQCPYAACRRDMITRHMRTHRGRSTHSSESSQS